MEAFPDLARMAAAVPIEPLQWPALEALGVHCWVRRDDLLPGWCQGNKFYKLYFNLQKAPVQACLVTFGGAFSNHIYALALAGEALGRKTVGIIRGERPAVLSPTLLDAQAAGMQLVFVSRQRYRELTGQRCLAQLPVDIEVQLSATGGYWLIPEGGANALGVQGCEVLGRDIGRRGEFDEVLLAAGTAATLAGVALGVGAESTSDSARPTRVTGVSVLGPVKSGGLPLTDNVSAWLGQRTAAPWGLIESAAPGRYGQTTPALDEFMDQFQSETGVQLDHVYTGKLFWVILQQALAGRWPEGSRLLAIHTGGLQGMRGRNFKG